MPDSDLSFHPEGDLDASGRHAEFRRVAGAWRLVDVGSRNGTFLNGERVKDAPLSDGDELEFGEGGPRLRVELPSFEEEQGDAVGDPAERASSAEVFPTAHPPERLSGIVSPPDSSDESQLRDALLATRHGEIDLSDAGLRAGSRLKGALLVGSGVFLLALVALALWFIE